MVILIACSDNKLATNVPVMAKDLYLGNIFSLSLKTAICLSGEVYILSAGYGILRLDDLVMPYDIKMVPSRALWFRRNKIAVFDKFQHFLPKTYASAVLGEAICLFETDGLAIGEQMEKIISLGKDKIPLINLSELRPNNHRSLLETGTISQEYRTGGNRSICRFIGNLFKNETCSLVEASLKCEIEFGPPLGLSYIPTVSRQLREQAKKLDMRIETYPIEGTRKLRYRYFKK